MHSFRHMRMFSSKYMFDVSFHLYLCRVSFGQFPDIHRPSKISADIHCETRGEGGRAKN